MKFINSYQFADAWVLWFLLLIPVLVVYYLFIAKKQTNPLTISSLSMSSQISEGFGAWLKPISYILRLLAITLFIVALARPQMSKESETYIEQYKEGIDIVIALDASGSMLAEDFKPDRFQAAKKVAQEFVSKRVNDRIGLVIFEDESYTQCPLTGDQAIVQELIGESKQGIFQGGTAIGSGLATAVNRLRDSDAKSKIIILLTDGVNTHGKIHPLTAAEIAKKFGIRVYTIGVGTNGKAKMPVAINSFNGKYIYDYVPVEIDEKTLEEISKMTDGNYFRATDNESLKQIYTEIDKLEKAKVETIEYEMDLPEQSMPLILLGLLLIGLELILTVVFKSLS